MATQCLPTPQRFPKEYFFCSFLFLLSGALLVTDQTIMCFVERAYFPCGIVTTLFVVSQIRTSRALVDQIGHYSMSEHSEPVGLTFGFWLISQKS